MANNRIYLACTMCDERNVLYLGKTMGVGYYDPPTQATLAAFYGAHESCTAANELAFRIEYEHADADFYTAELAPMPSIFPWEPIRPPD